MMRLLRRLQKKLQKKLDGPVASSCYWRCIEHGTDIRRMVKAMIGMMDVVGDDVRLVTFCMEVIRTLRAWAERDNPGISIS